VPGNHDVPLYNVLKRWRSPLKNYRRYIDDDLQPFFADSEIAVLGINSARSLTFKNGRINAVQVKKACERLAGQDAPTKFLVMHHPFDVLDPERNRDIVGRANMAMAAFARCGVDVILTGHLHLSRISSSAMRYQSPGYAALFIQAGTATSVRQRGEVNAWNLLYVEPGAIAVDCYTWDAQNTRFTVLKTDHFQRGPDGWSAREAASTASQDGG
jgi:3',5'-cyclic AMP phosphodiesterase CpdA